MLEYKNKKLVSLKQTDLKTNEILERYHLQESIINSWDAFKKEIGLPDLLLIGAEVCPHQSVQNSIDILAFDPMDSVPVVIELKRNKDKLQLLQALSYAGMVATWDKEAYLQVAKNQNITEISDLDNLLSGIENESGVKVILIAERFDPEVIITSDWLYSNFKIDISTFALNVFKKEDSTFFSFVRKYPLIELQDVYDKRGTRRASKEVNQVSWDEIKNGLKYDWGKELVDIFLEYSPGDTSRKRFPPLTKFRDNIPFDKISTAYREKWVLVYLWGKPESAEAILHQIFGEEADIGEWRDGYSIKLYTKKDAERFKGWIGKEVSSKAA